MGEGKGEGGSGGLGQGRGQGLGAVTTWVSVLGWGDTQKEAVDAGAAAYEVQLCLNGRMNRQEPWHLEYTVRPGRDA